MHGVTVAAGGLITLLLVLLGVEILFRVAFKLRGRDFEPPKRLKHLYLSPHPYLPYAFVPSIATDNSEPARYTLHRGEYEFRSLITNQYRCIGAELGPKQRGRIRVLCLGHSSTESTVWRVGGSEEFSWPLELGRYLDRKIGPGRFEVVNCGVGGWTTAEILVQFALNLLDADPDVVILHQGVNDLVPSLTPGFRSDYSHSRRNLGEEFWKIRVAAALPTLPWWKSYSYATLRVIGSGNVRHDIHAKVNLGSPDYDAPFRGLSSERRNIESLIHLCQGNGISIILSTFPYYLYTGAAADWIRVRLQQGVADENEVLRELAKSHRLPLVDIAEGLPRSDAFFLDSIHLSPSGMSFVAEQFGEALIALRGDAGLER